MMFFKKKKSVDEQNEWTMAGIYLNVKANKQ